MGGIIGGLAVAAVGIIVLVIAAIMFLVAGGLWGMRGWAYWLGAIVMVLGVIFGLGFPGGRIVAGVLLIYLILVRKHFNR